MEDLNIYVEYDKLSSDGDVLVNQASIVETNVANISDLISKNWDTWLGTDSASYVQSLSSFLNKLSQFSGEISKIGSHMKDVGSDYSTAVSSCIKELDSNE
jgi:hypothetical protein